MHIADNRGLLLEMLKEAKGTPKMTSDIVSELYIEEMLDADEKFIDSDAEEKNGLEDFRVEDETDDTEGGEHQVDEFDSDE